MRITQYGDQLVDDLKQLDRWPEKVRVMQENWIGRSKGCRFKFQIAGSRPAGVTEEEVEVYTTRPDTLYGASFVGIAADHPLAHQLNGQHNPEIAAFIEQCKRGANTEAEIETAEKLGIDTGIRVKHPFNPDWELPVWIATTAPAPSSAARPTTSATSTSPASTTCRSSRWSCRPASIPRRSTSRARPMSAPARSSIRTS
jgi:leucyl-tRNA synthetase